MEKNFKTVVIIIFIFILIFMGCMLYYNYENSLDKKIKVGETDFIIPNGYHEGKSNITGVVNLSDGDSNSIFLKENDDTNISNLVNGYESTVLEKNFTPIHSNFSIDGVDIYKLSVNNTNTNHYWFKHGNKVYEIYSWNKNDNLDTIVSNLIASTKVNS